jgi:uncharacterized OsmC-like protein
MTITASIKNSFNNQDIVVSTNDNKKLVDIAAKREGYGSSVNGGELLFLALATCFCNDIYREASKRKMNLHAVEVFVSGEFGVEGEPASLITYNCKVDAPNYSQQEINNLIEYVDKVAEVHNNLRKGIDLSVSNDPELI